MRGTRWLLLLAILAILAGIGVTYQTQKRALETHAPVKPPMLPAGLSGVRDDFQWSHDEAGHKKWELSGHKVRQEKDSNQVHLEQVTLKIYNKTGDEYDLVKSASAEFDQNASRMYSDGEVEVTLGVPAEGQPKRQLVSIKSSGVTFEVKTGHAATDRAAAFVFENGTGKSMGATYDPPTRELHLSHEAEIDWKAPTPHAQPMKIEAGELTYKEAESVVWLTQGARLTRQNTVVNAASSVVQLKDRAIHQIDAVSAQGTDEYPKRKLTYGAEELRVTYNDDGEVERISGKRNAHLLSVSAGSETAMTSDVVDLDFETAANDESILKKAVGTGHATIVSKPLPAPDTTPAETKVIHSELIEVEMRPGGREIQRIETRAPGRLDFLPNQPAQHQRRLDADSMVMTYGPGNTLQSFRAINVRTETEPNAAERARKQTVSKTHSRNMSAEFDSKGQMKHMEQWGDFGYEEADRRATAGRAALESDSNLMTLDGASRVWDSTGTTSADKIRMDQKTGDFAAEGHVSSSRQPDKKGAPSGMLSGDQPVEALADRMNAANHNRQLHYEGHTVMWQGADRIMADRVDVDREKRLLSASGSVITQFLEKQKAGGQSGREGGEEAKPTPKSQPPIPVFVTVRAAGLEYTDENRLAHYTGGVTLNRPTLQVKADELRAVLTESKKESPEGKKDTAAKEDDDQQSRLEKAFADGHVEIVQTAPDRTRTGTADHAEYYTDDERIILHGGHPQMLDSKKGYTRGAELTYYVGDDRLLVAGSPKERATGRLRRKP